MSKNANKTPAYIDSFLHSLGRPAARVFHRLAKRHDRVLNSL